MCSGGQQSYSVVQTSAQQIEMQSVTLGENSNAGGKADFLTRQAETEQDAVVDNRQGSERASPGASIVVGHREDVAVLHAFFPSLSSSSAELSVKKSSQKDQTIAGSDEKLFCPWVPMSMSV